MRYVYLNTMLKRSHNSWLRCALTSILVLLTFLSVAQDEKYYFNKDWNVCGIDDAKYYRIIEEVDTLLKVTDYYVSGGKQSEGFIENTASNMEILKIRGDFEQKTVGEINYYRKNGKLYSSVNQSPFDKNKGVDQQFFKLLKPVDTIKVDSACLFLETNYFSSTIEFGFMLDKSLPHGIWIAADSKTGTVLDRTLYNEGKLHGLSITYWRNGKVKEKAPYRNGVYHGEVKKYNRKGILVKGEEYKNGTLTESWIYKKPRRNNS